MGKFLIGVRNCLRYQITHLSFISCKEVTFPRFYGGHVVGKDMLHLPRPTMKSYAINFVDGPLNMNVELSSGILW